MMHRVPGFRGQAEQGATIVRGRNVRHANALRDQARQLRGAMTPAEGLLWDHLRRFQLAALRFRRQHVIDGFIVDFYCPAARLAIEVDGEIHADQTDYDRERDRILTNRGVRVLRFANDRIVHDLRACLLEIREAADQQPPHPTSPPPSEGEEFVK
jgi:very-short-patch-repair endonuclease